MPKDPFADQEDTAAVFFGLFKNSLSFALKRYRPRRKPAEKEKENDSNDAFDPALRPSKRAIDEKAKKQATEQARADAEAEVQEQKKSTSINETLTKYLTTSTDTLTKLVQAVDHTAKRVAQIAQQPQNINVHNNQQNINNSLSLQGKPRKNREVDGLLGGRDASQVYLEEGSRSGAKYLKNT